MRIAIMGPIDSIRRVREVAADILTDVEFIDYETFKLQDTVDMIQNCQNENDGILFTGISVYGAAKRSCVLVKPNHYVAHSNNGLLELFVKENIKAQSLSMDVIESYGVKQVSKMLNLTEWRVLGYNPIFNEEDYIKFHLNNVNSGFDCVITTFSLVLTRLKELGINAHRLYTTALDIKHSLYMLINDVKNSHLDSSKIAIYKVRAVFKKTDGYKRMEILNRVESLILEYCRSCWGCHVRDGNEFTIYTTKKMLLTHFPTNIFDTISNVDIYSGAGIERTVFDAQESALTALLQSVNKNISALTVIEDGVVQDYSYSVMSKGELKLREIAEKCSINLQYIYLINNLIIATSNKKVTSEQLTVQLKITRRSVNRILKRLQENGYAKLSGKKNINEFGRPYNIFEIDF